MISLSPRSVLSHLLFSTDVDLSRKIADEVLYIVSMIVRIFPRFSFGTISQARLTSQRRSRGVPIFSKCLAIKRHALS